MSNPHNNVAPVALFVYNRPRHTELTLRALSRNFLAEKTKLYVFCDGTRKERDIQEARLISEVRDLVKRQNWCGDFIVRERETNLGLAGSIRSGIDEVFLENDRIIVLEDDLITSPGFLTYMNKALSLYESDPQVMNISAHLPETSYQHVLPETFFLRNMSCWGWGTWRYAWQNIRWDPNYLLDELKHQPGGLKRFNLDGCYPFSEQLEKNRTRIITTWAIFWDATIYLAGGFSLFPGQSLVENIGTDGTGENFGSDESSLYKTTLAGSISVSRIKIKESLRGRYYMKSFYKYGRDSGIRVRLRRHLGMIKHRIAKQCHLVGKG
jgi:hypothetical protein